MPKPVSKLPRTEVTPEPALEKRTRRRFSAAYKLRIVSEADRCQRGELSACCAGSICTAASYSNGDSFVSPVFLLGLTVFATVYGWARNVVFR